MNRWDPSLWAALAIAFLLLGFIIGLPSHTPPLVDTHTHASNSQIQIVTNEGEWLTWKWFSDWLPQFAMALFALMLYFVTRNQRRISAAQKDLMEQQSALLRQSNETSTHALEEARKANIAAFASADAAMEATKQTKRSVDAYVAKERALLRLDKGTVTEHATVPGRKGLVCSFQNIGSGSATVRFFGVVYRALDWLQQPDWHFPTEHDLNTVVHSRDSLVVDHNRVGVHMLLPKDLVNTDGSLKSFYAFIKVTYETIGTRRCYYTTWMHWSTLNGPVAGVWPAFDLDIEIESEVAERALRAANAESLAKARGC